MNFKIHRLLQITAFLVSSTLASTAEEPDLLATAKTASETATQAEKAIQKVMAEFSTSQTAYLKSTELIKDLNTSLEKTSDSAEKKRLKDLLDYVKMADSKTIESYQEAIQKVHETTNAGVAKAQAALEAAAALSKKISSLNGEAQTKARIQFEETNEAALKVLNEVNVTESELKNTLKIADKSSSQIDPATAKAEAAVSEIEAELKKWGFSAGLGAFVMSGPREVKNAVNDNGTVKAEFESKQRVGLILECHYLVFGNDSEGSSKRDKDSDGHEIPGSSKREKLVERLRLYGKAERDDLSNGPSICVEMGTNGIRSVGGGWMLSLRRYSFSTNSESHVVGIPFNIGLYYVTEPRVKTLVGGLSDGSSIPVGTLPRFEEKPRSGVAVVFSASF